MHTCMARVENAEGMVSPEYSVSRERPIGSVRSPQRAELTLTFGSYIGLQVFETDKTTRFEPAAGLRTITRLRKRLAIIQLASTHVPIQAAVGLGTIGRERGRAVR